MQNGVVKSRHAVKALCSSSVFRAFRRFCGTATRDCIITLESFCRGGVGPKRFISFFNGDDDDFDERKRDRGGTTLKRNWIMMTLMMPSSFCAY